MSATISASLLTSGQWYNFLISMDMSSSSNRHVYINDVPVSVTWSTYTVNGTIAWVKNLWYVCGGASSASYMKYDFAQFYLTNEYLNLSVESNRRKFITSSLKPVDLGSDGSTPTGTSPIVYINGNATTWNAGANDGSGENFTMTGSVTNSSNEPIS